MRSENTYQSSLMSSVPPTAIAARLRRDRLRGLAEVAAALLLVQSLLALVPPPAAAQAPSQAPSAASAPGFWDPRRRPERPDIGRLTLVRFMTEVDYPPFDYAGQDGNPSGLNVDLARQICEELHVSCTVQM